MKTTTWRYLTTQEREIASAFASEIDLVPAEPVAVGCVSGVWYYAHVDDWKDSEATLSTVALDDGDEEPVVASSLDKHQTKPVEVLATRPHKTKDDRVAVYYSRRWRQSGWYVKQCWRCKVDLVYLSRVQPHGDVCVWHVCPKCQHESRPMYPGYNPPKPKHGGRQHGHLRMRRANSGY